MFRWLPLAMVRITLFFAAGILLNVFFPVTSFLLPLSIFVTLLILFILFHFITGFQTIHGLLAFPAVAMAGYLFTESRREETGKDHFTDFQHTSAWIGRVISFPEETKKSWKILVEMEEAKTTAWKKVSGKVLLYISGTPSLEYGDRLLIPGSPSPIPAPMNPGEFNYKQYLSYKNIFFRQYLKSAAVHPLPRHQSKGVVYCSHQVRLWASDVIKKYIPDKKAHGICRAIVLGITDGIDNELRDSFAVSGATHVLSVSGLHVGVITMLLLWLLSPFKKLPHFRWMECLICITALWAFAFVTGLAPSVMRSATMFSFFSMARVLHRQVNHFNILASSAFILLLCQPFMIMHTGFQFSYLAVIGIIYGFEKLNWLITPKTSLGNFLWEMVCLSLTAQGATFLLSLLYFHQFPNYFILTNLMAVPLVTLILPGGIALLAVSFFHLLATGVGFLVELSCRLLQMWVTLIEALPYSVTDSIHFTWPEMLFLSFALFSFLVFFETKNWKWIHVFTLLIILYTCARWQYFFKEITPRRLIVYSLPREEAVQFIDQGKSIHWQSKKSIDYFLNSNYASFGVKSVAEQKFFPITEYDSVKLFSLHRTKIAWLKSPSLFPPVDYLIIGQNAVPKLEDLKKVSSGIILDGSNTRTYTRQVENFCALNQIPLHAVAEKGAFVFAGR